jgi:hypothetical protein
MEPVAPAMAGVVLGRLIVIVAVKKTLEIAVATVIHQKKKKKKKKKTRRQPPLAEEVGLRPRR